MVMVTAVRSRKQAPARLIHLTISQQIVSVFLLLVPAGRKERGKAPASCVTACCGGAIRRSCSKGNCEFLSEAGGSYR